MEKLPNIFNYATSELSQDAFLCWFIACSDENQTTDKLLNKYASKFVRSLISEESDYEINSVEIRRQWKKIDVSVLVNKKYFIVIEDKKNTSDHSDQLNRYKNAAEEEYKNTEIEIKLVYFKMENESSFDNKGDYVCFKRDKMIELLKEYVDEAGDSKNLLLSSYYDYITEIEKSTNLYLDTPVDSWNYRAWQGFYMRLQKELKTGAEIYLQLEQKKLVVKIYCVDKSKRCELRDEYRKKIYSKAHNEIKFKNYGRVAKWMGILELTDDYIKTNNSKIDITETVKLLKAVTNILKSVCEK